MATVLESSLFNLVFLPLLIFLARICDVTIGTVRIVYISKGIKSLAAILAFFEVLIWLVTIRQVMSSLSNSIHYLAYAGGFATGTYVGIIVENRLSLGLAIIRVITRREGARLAEELRAEGYRVTDLEAYGNEGKVHILFTVIQRSSLALVQEIIKKFNPNAFYSIEDVRSARGIPQALPMSRFLHLFRRGRKGK